MGSRGKRMPSVERAGSVQHAALSGVAQRPCAIFELCKLARRCVQGAQNEGRLARCPFGEPCSDNRNRPHGGTQ
eukprot:11532213-Alexandrium_andersonii.AAC.1